MLAEHHSRQGVHWKGLGCSPMDNCHRDAHRKVSLWERNTEGVNSLTAVAGPFWVFVCWGQLGKLRTEGWKSRSHLDKRDLWGRMECIPGRKRQHMQRLRQAGAWRQGKPKQVYVTEAERRGCCEKSLASWVRPVSEGPVSVGIQATSRGFELLFAAETLIYGAQTVRKLHPLTHVVAAAGLT